MVCKCVDSNGSLLDKCIGTCKIEVIHLQMEQQHRDPLNGFAELIMSQVDKLISSRIYDLKFDILKESKKIQREEFMEGLREGIEIGRTLYDK